MVTSAVTTIDSAQSSAEVSPDAEFEKFRSDANARDLDRMKAERGEAPETKTPKTEESAPSKDKKKKTETETEEVTTQSDENATAGAEEEDDDPQPGTAAASGTATTEERARKESSHQKLRRLNREHREKIARLEGELAARKETPERRTEPQATAKTDANKDQRPAKPKIDDVDPVTKQPKYKTFADYEEAKDAWLRDDVKHEIQQSQTETDRQRQQRETQETISREFGRRVGEAKKKYADFDAVALAGDLPVKQGSVLDAFILDSPHGTDVLYHLGKNRADLERIQGKPVYDQKGVLTGFTGGLNPLAQAREFTKLELKFAPGSNAAAPQKKVTSAPEPVRTVTANGTTAADDVSQALKTDDVSGYFAAQNARDIARARGR